MASVVIIMAMVAVQFVEVGLNTLFKAATTNGMSKFVFVVYSNALALCFLLPFTFLYHRKVPPPPISRSIVFRIFVTSVLSCASQTLTYSGIQLSSPTLSSALMDLLPALAFILAILSRMENLDLKLRSSQAKAIGTVVSITGALIVTLYKGIPITHGPVQEKPLSWVLLSQPSNWLLGGFLLSISTLFISVLLIIQVWVLRDYPSEIMFTTICCIFVVVVSAIVAFSAEGASSEAWIFRQDIELVAIFYKAIFLISLRSVVFAWAARKKGPIFVSMFSPLGMVIAIGMGVIFLRESLYLGSMIGACIIGIGFYSVMWGMAKEEKIVNEEKKIIPSPTSPLLENKSLDA